MIKLTSSQRCRNGLTNKIINVMYHIKKKIKDRKDMAISLDVEKASYNKLQHPFMIKKKIPTE